MDESTLGIMIPLTAVFMGLLIPIVYAVLDYRRRRDLVQAHHKERLAAIERGMDIPPLPEAFFNPMQNRRPRHLLTGMVWFFIGLALFPALWFVAGHDVAFFGLIPAGIGMAFLIYYAVEGKHEAAAWRGEASGTTGAKPPHA
jgi:hypothetical protein